MTPAGNALLTVATGKLSEGESERAGLVTTHAYAVLNLADIKVCAVHLTPAVCLPSQCRTVHTGTYNGTVQPEFCHYK